MPAPRAAAVPGRAGRAQQALRCPAMDDQPGTRLKPRPVRVVHKLRATVKSGPDAGATCTPDDDAPLTIGTSADNALVLTDPAVSHYHVELRAGVAVADL